MNIGERIRKRRLDLGLTQDEVAKKVGYKSRSSIQKIECARSLPLNKVEIMACALECEPSYLMGWISEDTAQAKSIREFYKHNPLSDEEWEIIKMYRKVDDSTRKAAYNVLRGGIVSSNSLEVG